MPGASGSKPRSYGRGIKALREHADPSDGEARSLARSNRSSGISPAWQGSGVLDHGDETGSRTRIHRVDGLLHGRLSSDARVSNESAKSFVEISTLIAAFESTDSSRAFPILMILDEKNLPTVVE